ncbi:MAG TPA: alpha-ketoacid dehydrogenase subunit beta, partial [Pyrinomonadaceae bacterium]
MSTALKKERKLERPPRGGMSTMVEAIRQGIWEEMERDPTVFLIGEDVGVYGGAFKVTEGIIDHFGKERVVDTPISEAAIVGAACGAALMGMKPVAEFQFIDFISCGFDLLTNYAAKCRYRWGANIPAVFRGPCGSGVRSGPFHSLNAESFFLNTAGLKIVEPATAYDAKGLIKAAIRDPDPVLYFEHKKLYRMPRLREELPEDDYIVEIGKARTARAGRDVSIIT